MIESYRQVRRAALVGMVETTCRLAQFCVDDGEASDEAELRRLEDAVVLLETLRRLLTERPPP